MNTNLNETLQREFEALTDCVPPIYWADQLNKAASVVLDYGEDSGFVQEAYSLMAIQSFFIGIIKEENEIKQQSDISNDKTIEHLKIKIDTQRETIESLQETKELMSKEIESLRSKIFELNPLDK